MTLLENEPLCRHTTLRVGGPARFFVQTESVEEVRQALQLARQRALPVYVLGGGSNVLASDQGFAGVVMKLCSRGLAETAVAGELENPAPGCRVAPEQPGDAAEVTAEAGEDLSRADNTTDQCVVTNHASDRCRVFEAVVMLKE